MLHFNSRSKTFNCRKSSWSVGVISAVLEIISIRSKKKMFACVFIDLTRRKKSIEKNDWLRNERNRQRHIWFWCSKWILLKIVSLLTQFDYFARRKSFVFRMLPNQIIEMPGMRFFLCALLNDWDDLIASMLPVCECVCLHINE